MLGGVGLKNKIHVGWGGVKKTKNVLGGVGLIGYWGLAAGEGNGGGRGWGEGGGGGDQQAGGRRWGEGGGKREGRWGEGGGKREGGGGGGVGTATAKEADGCSRKGYLKSEMTAATGDFGRRRPR